MTTLTAFRSIPEPIVGMVRVQNDAAFLRLEDALDWLETTGVLVERFDPATEPEAVAERPVARQLLATDERCLPLMLVDGLVVLQGVWPSRSELARAVGRASAPARHAA